MLTNEQVAAVLSHMEDRHWYWTRRSRVQAEPLRRVRMMALADGIRWAAEQVRRESEGSKS